MKNLIHNECECIHILRILKTKNNEFVFDTRYNNTLILSDGNEYETIKECTNKAIEFLAKIDTHETIPAIVC